MSRICFVTGAKTLFGHSISHSQIKTNRQFKVNLFERSVFSDLLGLNVNVTVSHRGMRTIQKHGSLDNFILTTKSVNLTEEALKLKRKLKKILKIREVKASN